MANGNGFSMTLPVLDTKNYDRWMIHMKAIFEFQEIAGAKTTKEAWDSLEKSYEGATKIKKVKLQTIRRKYELLQMEESETISDYLTKILTLTNQMKACGEEVRDQSVIEKVLRTLTPKYDHIVVAIEESKDLDAYKFEELQSSLEAHEKGEAQALQTQSVKISGGHWNNNVRRNKDRWNYGHYAAECKFNKTLGKKNEEARLAQGAEPDDDDHYMFMTTTKNSEEDGDFWYLDIGCSNHMTISVEGIGKVMIKRRDGKSAYISNVLYVPKMKSNLLSLGQLLEKGYTMEMKDGMMKVFDKNKHNILKAPISANRTFKIDIQMSDQRCLQSTLEKDTWL
ncbi:PREDICTED: uncharacterized protein LOC109329380 [Lupinus angustifolius]|uniref:uncharacterized protein LOC109329380 n=1 Tax=Lupinus angustifolius TaxID=3871 RepID=UPI00092EC4D0|nr:PREDICTED: uncharacterized protein LOC109329380 [Lupinus angustifolius]